MTNYFTKEYSPEMNNLRSGKLAGCSAIIVKAEHANNYRKRYGKNSLTEVGYKGNELIMEIQSEKFINNQTILFDKQEDICDILTDYHTNKPSTLEGKATVVLRQFNRFVGIST